MAQAAENITDETLAKVLYAFLTAKKFDKKTFEQFKGFFTQVNSKLIVYRNFGGILSKLSENFLTYFVLIEQLNFNKKLYLYPLSGNLLDDNMLFKNFPELHISMDLKTANFAFAHLDGLVVMGGKNQSRKEINFAYASMKNAFFGHKTQKVSKVAKGKIALTRFCFADMTCSRFENLEINQVNFRGAITKEVLLKNCNLSEINLSPEERKSPPWNSVVFTTKEPAPKKRVRKKQAATETAFAKDPYYHFDSIRDAPMEIINSDNLEFSTYEKKLIYGGDTEIIKQSQEEINELLESSENPENLDLTLLGNAFVFDSIEEEAEFFDENSVSIEGTGTGIANKLVSFGMYASEEKSYPPYLSRTENLEKNKQTSLQSELHDNQLDTSMQIDAAEEIESIFSSYNF